MIIGLDSICIRKKHAFVDSFHIIAHRLLFFAIKSVRNAFESSESTNLMIVDNVLRSLKQSPYDIVDRGSYNNPIVICSGIIL